MACFDYCQQRNASLGAILHWITAQGAYLGAGKNDISGAVPERITSLTVLRALILVNNSLSGELPALYFEQYHQLPPGSGNPISEPWGHQVNPAS